MKLGKRCLSILLAVVMLCTLITPYMGVAEAADADNVTWIQSADDFPTEIAEGDVYALANDITLNEGQQIGTLAGVLDGQGHTIILNRSALANTITGTVQNLGTAGTVTLEKSGGSFAENFSGVIQNCFTTATVSSKDYMSYWSGFIGNMTGGIIQNSYFAGDTTFGAAFVAGGTVANLLHTVAAQSGSFSNCDGVPGDGQNLNDCHKIGDFEDPVTSWADAIAVLNTEIPDTGFIWVLEGELPSLKSNDEVVPPESETIDKTALEAAIMEAQQYTDPSLYTQESWDALQTALTEAQNVFENEAAVQDEINETEAMLRNAIAGLTKAKPTQPVAIPDDGTVIEIGSTAEWVKTFDGATDTEGKYYVLTDSIVLGANDYTWLMNPFNGVLDGQGHTITFDGSSRLFNFVDIGETGVVQNIQFAGTIGGQGPEGALGAGLKGAVLNCSFDVETIEGGKSSGIARCMDGGVISNCYVKGNPDNAFVAEYLSGNIFNSYWMDGLNNPISTEVMKGCTAKTASEMKSSEFIELLNANSGEHGITWGQNVDGYPYFGEDIYDPNPDPKPEESVTVGFTPYNSTETQLIEAGELSVSPDFVNQFRVAGTLSLPEYVVPEGGSIEWYAYETAPEYAVDVSLESGELYVDSIGETMIKAVLVKGDGSTEELTSIHVTSAYAKAEAIQLYIDGTEVTNGTYTVQGSEDKSIQIKARYEGTEEFVDVSTDGYSFEADHPEYLYQYTNGSYVSFAKPETVIITVTSKADENIKATVNLTSEYVPVESIKPGISGTITVHGRNANDWQNNPPRFNPDYSGVIVEPANASSNRKENWSVTSSDDSIANYTETAYNAAKAGTVTFTATIEDTDPAAGKTRKISGESQVTYVYQNPLVSVTGPEQKLSLKNNTEMPLELTFTGTEAKEDYSITEPSLNWTYDKEGIVRISRTNEGAYRKLDESEKNAKDYGLWLLDEEYTIHAIGEGTVTATGTPVDTTGGAEPVVVKIQVTEGEALPEADNDEIVKEGLENTIQNIKKQEPADGYVFGQEWEVFSLIRAGEKIDTVSLDHYYKSVEKALKEWDEEYGKPTDLERAAIALTAMGKDITDVDGVNLAELIYNNPYLQNGSNELNFALIALDAAGIEIPKEAKWSRESIIEKILTFQNENGGFGLYDNKYASVDSTAMTLQALAPYMDGRAVKRAVKKDINEAAERGMEYLKSELSDTYGYGTSEADSQVIITLAVLGLDPLEAGFGTEYQNILSHLTDTYAVEGGFSHVPGGQVTQMSTLQALQAFEAYRRYAAGEEALWDLPPIKDANPGEELSQAERVEKAIQNLPSVDKITLKDEAEVNKVRGLYDALSDKEKEKVSNYQKLLDAENRIVELKAQPIEEIKVNFTLYGAAKEAIDDSSRPTRKETWVEKTEVTVLKDSTVYDVFDKVLSEKGIEYKERTNYIKGIKSPITGEWMEEFTNGPRSGWMYEVNGVYVEEGLRDRVVQNGDTIVWRYVNDFTDRDDPADPDPNPGEPDPEEPEKPSIPVNECLEKAVQYLKEHVTDPVVDTVGGEWSVIAMARANALPKETKQNYLTNLYATLEEKQGVLDKRKYTEYARVALALTAIGTGPDDVNGYNLLLPLAELENVKWQGVNGPIWALIALDAQDYEIPELPADKKEKYTQTTRDHLLGAILDSQLTDGGWSLAGKSSDADMTAMAIQALAPYYGSHTEVTGAVDRALETLSALQSDNGGFGSYHAENLESAAQVVIALSALDVTLLSDERFVKNGNSVLDYLLTYQLSDGSFKHAPKDTEVDALSTDQGALALLAYTRAVNGQTSLYDMSDMDSENGDIEETPENIAAFQKKMNGLPDINNIRIKDEQAVFALLSELDGMGTFAEKEEYRSILREKLDEIKKQKAEVEQLDQDIWDKIDPRSVKKEDADTVKELIDRYNRLPEENKQYVRYREDLFKANEMIEKLQKEETNSQKTETETNAEKENEKTVKPQGTTIVSGKSAKKKTEDKEKTIVKATVKNNIVDKSQVDAIKGTKKNLVMRGKMGDGTAYTFTLNGEDVKKSGDIHIGLARRSPYEKEINQLAENPYILHFLHEGAFPGQILVNVEVDLEDGEYLLLFYDKDQKKAEYIQKIGVKDQKTRFIIEKGGTYFIAKKVSTKSVDELKTDAKPTFVNADTDESELQQMNRKEIPPFVYGIVGLCAGCLLTGAAAYLIYRKKGGALGKR